MKEGQVASGAAQLRPAAKELQLTPVAGKRLAPGGVDVVTDAELLAGGAHNWGKARVVKMTDMRQQVGRHHPR